MAQKGKVLPFPRKEALPEDDQPHLTKMAQFWAKVIDEDRHEEDAREEQGGDGHDRDAEA